MAWEQCPFPVPGVTLECGALEVYADRDDPDAGTVTLRFAIARGGDQGDSPLVYLAGGPGQSALELMPTAWGELYAPLAEGRDLIVVDQRGIGFSEPSLFCDEYSMWAREALASDAAPEEQAAAAAEALDACRERLVAEGVDFSHFTSAASAADIEDLRQALGYDTWDLYGNSYGSRLALTAMRDFPDGIRSVVLDAVYPVEADLYAETPANVARAFDALFAACEADAACAEAYPDLEGTFRATVDRLNANPESITMLDTMTGQRFDSELTGDGLVGFLFQSLYATDLIPFLPEILGAASEGSYGTVGLLQGAFVSQIDIVSLGMQIAVQCHEEVAFSDQAALESAAAEYPLLRGFFEQSATLGAGVHDICGVWRMADADPSENEPVASDIPTLILTGSMDPITPPRWGEAVAANLSNAYTFEFPYTGHGVVNSQECGATVMRAFLDDPDSEPDGACIEDIAAPAFTPGEVDATMVPFSTPDGAEGLRPEEWTELFPGVFQQSVLVALVHQIAPGVTEDLLLQQVAAQLGTEVPAPTGTIEGADVTWTLYELDDLGQAVDLAVAEHEGSLLLVQLTASPSRRDAYFEQIFRPAVEAFTPPETPVAPLPGGTPTTPTNP